jgi:hypothetical protein
MFDRTKERLGSFAGAAAAVASAAAPRIQATFRRAATTRRGNVPSFGPRGDVPIIAKARPEAIYVSGPAWCVAKARARGQIAGWRNIIREEARRIFGGGER